MDALHRSTESFATGWRNLFSHWPAELPRNGAIVTSLGEQITFREFMTTDSLLLIERHTPDSIGTRQVILPYAKIEAVKITNPVNNDVFAQAGFRSKSAGV